MKKLKNYLIVLFFAILFLLIGSTKSAAASDFTYKSMDYDVQINADGSMDIVETWKIKIDGTTNTLFKNWDWDDENFSGITNAKVTEVTSSGAEKELKQTYTEAYHVATGYYYAMDIDDEEYYEIAWGVNDDSGTKTYKIYYTVEDCIKEYNDCFDLCWKFVNKVEVNVDSITGTIKLPEAVESLDNLYIWGHGYLDGEVWKEDNQTIKFKAKDYEAEYLEIRMVTTEDIFSYISKSFDENKLDEIKEIEKEIADKANAEKLLRKIINIIISVIFIIIASILNFLFIRYTKKRKNELEENPKLKPTQELEYFRDFPRADATPAEVAFLYYFNAGKTQGAASKILSATMLDLALKKYISFEIDASKKANSKESIKIIVADNTSEDQLKESERLVLTKLKQIMNSETKTFTMKDFEKYAQNHSSSFYSMTTSFEDNAKMENAKAGTFDREKAKKGSKYTTMFTLGIILLFIQLIYGTIVISATTPFLLIVEYIEAIFVACSLVTLGKLISRFKGITQEGVNEQEKYKGLKKYMEDFSLLNEKEVPDLVLWEKYLVYATVFGVAEKVIKQLKIVYPQMSDSNYMSNTSYLYIVGNTNFGTSFISTMNSSVSRAYQSSMPSSSSGGGGGFSGGGGGGGGGGCSGGR